MKYSESLRNVLRYLPLTVKIEGRSKSIVLGLFDRLFDHTQSAQTISVDGQSLFLDISQSGERLLYYAAYNLLDHYRRSDLCFVMSEIYKRFSGFYVDVGANLGMYAFLAKGMGARVCVFEPEPIHFAFLERNRHIFDEIYNYALGGSCKKSEFYVATKNSGGSSLVMSSKGWEESGYDHVIQVTVTTFDEFVKTIPLDLSLVRLIKIDVEGGEYATLLGMKEYLTREDSAVIWCEVRGPGSDRGNNYVDIIKYMEQFGYQSYTVKNTRLSIFNSTTTPPSSVFDLLFIVPARHLVFFQR